MIFLLKKLLIVGIILIFIGVTITPAKTINRTNMANNCNSEAFYNARFDGYMNFLMKAASLPSLSACIIKDDKIVWSNGYGFYDMENNKKATDNTIYLIGSITKAVTGTALLQLYDQGLFDLDDDVNDYLPFSLRNPNHPDDPITFRMLLAHQSSLSQDYDKTITGQYYVGDIDIPSYPYPWLEDYLTPSGSLYSPNIWSDTKPGEEYNYCQAGYCLCGYLIEILSGQEFNEYCKEHIFEPLEMYNTSFYLADLNLSNVAIHYMPYKMGLKTILYSQQHFTIFVYPAGGLRTTVVDLAHFLIAHMNSGVYNGTRILDELTVQEMHKVQYPRDDLTYGYGSDFEHGLGWKTFNRPFKKNLSGARGSFYLGLCSKMIYSSYLK